MKNVKVNRLFFVALLCVAVLLPTYLVADGGEWITEIDDGFEGDFPGPWQRTVNSGNYGWGWTDYMSVEGTEGTGSIWCADKNYNNAEQLFPGGVYGDNMDASITFGPFDTRYCAEGFFSFYIWHRMSVNDYVRVDANTGQGWGGVEFGGSSVEWKKYEFDLAAFPNVGNLLGQKNVWIKFRFTSDGGGASTGAFIDSVVIKKYFTGWPDLAVQSISNSPTLQIQSKKVSITIDVTNPSQNRTPQNECVVFLSNDNQYDATDLILDNLIISPLDGGKSQKLFSTVFAPLAVSPGDYYIGAIIDPSNGLIENDENNNLVISQNASLSIVPDIGWETVVDENFENNEFPVGMWQNTAGAGTSYGWDIEDYMSFDGNNSLWCTGKTLGNGFSKQPETGYANNANARAIFGTFSMDECIKGDLSFAVWRDVSYHEDVFSIYIEYGQGLQGYNLPMSTYGWQYYQFDLTAWPVLGNLVGINHINAWLVFESDNEGTAKGVFIDNFLIRKKLALPDLIVPEVTFSTEKVAQGGEITVTAQVKNRDLVESDTTKVKYYLSADQTITQDDILLGENDLFILKPGETKTFDHLAMLPADLEEGVYYIGAIVDGDELVAETVESNNDGVALKELTVFIPKPDLFVNVLNYSPMELAAGESIQISIQVKNEGEVNTEPSTVLYVLSSDKNISDTDVQLASHEVAALAPEEMATYEKALQIPNELAAGNYYIIVVVDPDNTLEESDETNNAAMVAKAIKVNPTGVEGSGIVPTEFSLSQNYPNPFNPTTRIQFALPKASFVRLVITNAQGRLIRVLANQSMDPGFHYVTWDGLNSSGEKVASGIYLYQVQAESFHAERKMLLMQ